jgi:hypothetical protein
MVMGAAHFGTLGFIHNADFLATVYWQLATGGPNLMVAP